MKLISLMKAKFEVGMSTNEHFLSERAVQELWISDKIEAKKESLIMAARLCKKLKIIP